MKCYCGRFEALPQIGGQISDGIIHVAELPWDGIVPCQVAELTREVQRLRDALEAITHAEVGGAPCISGAVAADALGIPWPPAPAADAPDLANRITDYLASGGLFNPEMANHDAVRDLLMDCRDALTGRDRRAPAPAPGARCGRCGGTGYAVFATRIGLDDWRAATKPNCPACGGKGDK